MKKLLLLGGSRYLIPAIKAAHELGVYVITADYLPDNAAHKYSDEYHNVSIVDKETVLKLAQELCVDGIMSYATDPGVTVAAYVAEKLGLPTSPYESVALLQNKGKFRAFLRDNGFNVPYAKTYTDPQAALQEADDFNWPVVVKPVDSAGSKGVRRVDDRDELVDAAKYALKYSLTDEFIVEEFIEQIGFSSDTDSFSVDGKLVYASFNNQWFDKDAANPYTPSGYIWPSSMPADIQSELRSELQRLMSLLNMGTTIYNIETRQGKDGKAYIMECTPRAGGNRLAEVLKLASGQDIIMASVKAALGMPAGEDLTDPVYNGHWGEVILHSNKDGIFEALDIDEDFLKNNVQELDLWINPGDEVHCFTGANETIGTLVIRCDSQEALNNALDSIHELVNVRIKK
ncbi:MAG: ATP-grasp domain-containing protein [Acutalibacteraceae bacterium]